jgi:two-component system, cell cycle sensor histidine kinase and response regulator CckA
VAAMKTGAHDYIIKSNISRLLPVIEREINESKIRAERKLLEHKTEALGLSEEKFNTKPLSK